MYPTRARVTGFGFCNSASRLAGMATPWIAVLLGGDSGDAEPGSFLWLPVAVYSATSVAASALAVAAFVNRTGSAPLE